MAGAVAGAAGGDSNYRDDDRRHRYLLPPSRSLRENPLRNAHQHKQAKGKGRLDHQQWRKDQSQQLERPTDDRQRGTG